MSSLIPVILRCLAPVRGADDCYPSEVAMVVVFALMVFLIGATCGWVAGRGE